MYVYRGKHCDIVSSNIIISAAMGLNNALVLHWGSIVSDSIANSVYFSDYSESDSVPPQNS